MNSTRPMRILVLAFLLLPAPCAQAAAPQQATPETQEQQYLEREQLHRFDRHTPLPYRADGQPHPQAVQNVIFVPGYAVPPAVYPLPPPPPPLPIGATRTQEIYFSAVSEVRPQGNGLWLSGTGAITTDNRTGYQNSTGVQVLLENADGGFLSDCMGTLQNPILPGHQLLVSGQGAYTVSQGALWSFDITAPALCELIPTPAIPVTGR